MSTSIWSSRRTTSGSRKPGGIRHARASKPMGRVALRSTIRGYLAPVGKLWQWSPAFYHLMVCRGPSDEPWAAAVVQQPTGCTQNLRLSPELSSKSDGISWRIPPGVYRRSRGPDPHPRPAAPIRTPDPGAPCYHVESCAKLHLWTVKQIDPSRSLASFR